MRADAQDLRAEDVTVGVAAGTHPGGSIPSWVHAVAMVTSRILSHIGTAMAVSENASVP
jgi:hypothetical protein